MAKIVNETLQCHRGRKFNLSALIFRGICIIEPPNRLKHLVYYVII